MTDTTLPAPRRSGFRFDRYASGFPLLASIVLYVGLVVVSGQTKYLSVDNLVSILGRSITLGITAIGQTFAILVASIDLSVASPDPASAVVTSVVMNGEPSRCCPPSSPCSRSAPSSGSSTASSSASSRSIR